MNSRPCLHGERCPHHATCPFGHDINRCIRTLTETINRKEARDADND